MSRFFAAPTRRAACVFATLASLWAAVPALAQGYPEKPITLVVASAAGGAGDNLARVFAEELHKRLKQPVVVENVGGASGALGAQKVLRAPADGYTLLFGVTGDMVLTPIANRAAGYVTKDFTPIAKLSITPLALAVRPGLNVTTFAQLVALAKQRPGTLSIAISGNVSLSAFATVAVMRAAQVDLLTVPYKSPAPMMNDLLGGQVDLATAAIPALLPHVRAGKLTVVGLLSEERSPIVPEWPTLNESALVKGVSVEAWASIAGPPNLPSAIVDKLNRTLQDTLRDKAFVDARTKLGDTLAAPASAESFGRFLAAEEARYRQLAAGMKFD
jgi:tripartite-type tricarboxylate transporter receptor subunit TctC